MGKTRVVDAVKLYMAAIALEEMGNLSLLPERPVRKDNVQLMKLQRFEITRSVIVKVDVPFSNTVRNPSSVAVSVNAKPRRINCPDSW